ncbi:Choline-sulfatase [Planctomycetes bacterium Pla163]|uniref:Choline-sulfatase n=1 Tax=Rohdeia mirabilis TaxID=2528008 RepID=A0A518D4Q4_9BACT|nr:Choline-sulfatase [Planctomycetes bacterium Pla163]
MDPAELNADVRWIHLLEGYEPDLEQMPDVVARGVGWVARLENVGGKLWLRVEYSSEAWEATPIPGAWSAPRVVPSSAISLGSTVVAYADELELTRIASSDEAVLRRDLTDVFTFVGDDFVIRADADGGPPSSAVLMTSSPLGRPDGARWFVESGRFAGNGLMVLPGSDESFSIAGGVERDLSFGYFATAMEGSTEPLKMKIRQDGDVIWERSIDVDALGAFGILEHDRVALRDSTGSTQLSFEVTGGLAYSGFASPVVGPRVDPKAPSATLDGRPNLVLFVADTLRADTFELYRSLADSPTDYECVALEALADRSTGFLNSWSTSTWTLPAHASMFTSLLPAQHGAYHPLGPLERTAQTLAETLRSAGYRTVAVTDGGFVTAAFGLAQGFELFDQYPEITDRSLDRARHVLETGDGRPTFLFVQTYYPHAPLEPSAAAQTRVGLGDEPTPLSDIDQASRELAALSRDGRATRDLESAVLIRSLYRAQVLDFDDEFGMWIDEFARYGWEGNSHLFFTSDHGEPFGDHNQIVHGGEPWESQTRAPLFWSGPGVDPGVRNDVASGIDLAPTFAGLADTRVPEAWRGRDLADVDPTALAWAHVVASASGDHDGLVLMDRRSKLFAHSDRGERLGFDLADDPDEEHELDPLDATWPTSLTATFEARESEARTSILPPAQMKDASPELLKHLRAMGYLDEE